MLPWLNLRAHQPSTPSHTKLKPDFHSINTPNSKNDQNRKTPEQKAYLRNHQISPDKIQNGKKLFVAEAQGKGNYVHENSYVPWNQTETNLEPHCEPPFSGKINKEWGENIPMILGM